MKTLNLHPWLWATVTLSSILAMPAWSAPDTNSPTFWSDLFSSSKPTQVATAAKPKPKVEAAKPKPVAAKPAIAKPAAKPATAPVAVAKPIAAKPVVMPAPAAQADVAVALELERAKAKAAAAAKAAAEKAALAKKNDSLKKRPFIVELCKNKVNGTYIFGRAPYGCDASSYEDTSKVLENMDSLVFNEKKNQNEEVKRYSTAMYRFARDAADEYITRRNPNVSKAEKEAFRKGVMALMHQESFWSHYRISAKDGNMKIMKGDQDFSFGMMQIHGRWHKDMLMKYEGWTVKGNLAYGMDMYYSAWQKAKSASCVKNFDQRARSAYAVYNAGSWAGCRWTNPDDKWARNDTGFYQKYTGQLWNKLIDKGAIVNMPSPVKMACIFDTGGSSCVSTAEDTRTL
ncbi:MAG: hypothetical protein AB7K68_11935 [Bacteriovoracia bacterium]